jgi:hypothetical protein
MAKYDNLSRKQALDIANQRNEQGADIDLNGTVHELRAALELDDAARVKPAPPSLLPVIETPETVEVIEPAQPLDHEYTHGFFIHRATGEKYALCIHAPNTYEKTHTAKNTARTWQGNDEEFRLAFDPVK